jgi:hypothetical protein
MWSMIPVFVIVLSQTTQPIITSKSYKWCFSRGQGSPLCEKTEDECIKLHDLNPAIARSRCKRIELPEVKLLPPEPG